MENLRKDPEFDSLREALDLFEEIKAVKERDGELYDRVASSMLRQQLRDRRRRMAARICAAVALPALIVIGILLYPSSDGEKVAANYSSPILTLPSGAELLTDELTPESFATGGGASVSVGGEGLVFRREAETEAETVQFANLTVPRGRTYDIKLEDGTRVWLNSDSRLRFPTVFLTGERVVEFEGEAYFEVAHDAERPFSVVSGGQTVKVLGTQFNLRAYNDEQKILTTLVEGGVAVSVQEGRVILAPGQQAVFDREDNMLGIKDVDAEIYVAWRSGMISMEGRTLEQIAATLSRLYDVEVVFRDDKVRGLTYKGSVPKYDDIFAVLDIIEAGSPVKFRMRKNRIEISAE